MELVVPEGDWMTNKQLFPSQHLYFFSHLSLDSLLISSNLLFSFSSQFLSVKIQISWQAFPQNPYALWTFMFLDAGFQLLKTFQSYLFFLFSFMSCKCSTTYCFLRLRGETQKKALLSGLLALQRFNYPLSMIFFFFICVYMCVCLLSILKNSRK